MTQYLTHVPEGTYEGQAFHNPQPLPLDADTADFSDFGDRINLSTLGIFHDDRTDYRKLREQQTRHRAKIEAAYASLGLNRDREHARIAARIAHLTPEGIWPRSTGRYAGLCIERDREVLALTNTEL